MGYFRRLPLALKLIGLIGPLLFLAAFAALIASSFLPYHFFGSLGFPNLDDVYLSSVLLADVLVLGMISTFCVVGYVRQLRRGRPTSALPSEGQILWALRLLAILPLVVLALELFAPATVLFMDFTYGLGNLAWILMLGWYSYIIIRFSRDGSTGSPAGAAPAAPAGAGGNASVTPTTQNPTPFKWGWWSFDLGQYRPCDGTYCFYPYESLPPIRALRGTLDWLGPLDAATDQQMEIHRNAPDARGQLGAIQDEAASLGLTLPDAFVRLMGSPELQDRIPSCTACTFGLPKRILPAIGGDPGYIIRFLNDQQDVLIWYLYLTPTGEERVLVTPYEFDEREGANPNDLPDETRKAVLANTIACAPSFEAFVYRFWLENSIWFTLNDGKDDGKLTDEERRYLDHYEHQGNGPPAS